MKRLALPALVLSFAAASVATAGAASAAPTEPAACFGAFSSTFAQMFVPSGALVSGAAPGGGIGTVASEKPNDPTGCP
ncbi:hypothetical protein SAMN05660690_3748 [Geodermatophilus telluris]|uniref:Secreted protein n=1 Tax=Geodermatophilus telluris TaxID=1190417 RepID=A0A1G6T644_9ACTN|nr:hypothetical protein [Geodermatophilus telluris]SDD24006.1 hypothetical protein SAMN05660690_3748 [Geodermatophilus telluris]